MQPSEQARRYEELAAKWLNGTITPEEQAEFAAWFNAGTAEPLEVPEHFAASEEAHRLRILAGVRAAAGLQREPAKTFPLRRWVAAASVILAIGAAAWYLARPAATPRPPVAAASPVGEEPAPGGNKAVLTLGNGAQIVLDTAATGQLATQGNTTIVQTQQGRLEYRPEGQEEAATALNTLRTPKGGQYMIVLPDGTKAWLNSQSILQFPAAFSGRERVVQLTGEAYFEVAADVKRPFRVQSNGTLIEVLGTRFNVMAYTNEPLMETTLLEGAVRVSKAGQSEVLRPGRQAQLSDKGMTVRTVDVEDAVAWKSGLFRFSNDSLHYIMRQLERWYDVEVDYASIPDREFSGILRRDAPLKEVLKMLEVAGQVKFAVEGRRIKTIR
ncbi:FecR family protein [Chitinophaga lutea]